MQERLYWIDFSKGVAITLVVVGHASRGIVNARIPDVHGVLMLIDETIYAFHMPLFFILSGITFGMRPPNNIKHALSKKAWRLLYAMSVWTYAFLAMRAFAGDNSNAGGSFQEIFILPIPPFAHFWFIWALLLNIIFFSVLKMSIKSSLSDIEFWALALVITIIAQFTIELPDALIPYFAQALSYSTAFVVGALFSASPLLSMRPNFLYVFLGTALFLMTLAISVTHDLIIPRETSGIIVSLCLIFPLASLYYKSRGSMWSHTVVYIGIMSLSIYVMHTMFSATLRILLVKIKVFDLSTHLILGSAIGILGPLAVYLIARRLGILRIAGLA